MDAIKQHHPRLTGGPCVTRFLPTFSLKTAGRYSGRQFGYAYDPIGNRTSASETIGGGTLAKAYTANALNQYTAIDNPNAVGLRGDATNTAVVTVNGEAVQSDDITSDTIPWHFALEADNAADPDFPYAEIVAVVNPPDTNTPALVSTAGGHVYAPPQSETLTYDDDGNLLSDGRWQYTWNGENRLIKAEELVSPTNRQPYVVEYTYDHRGRMVWKTIATTNAPPSKTIRYLWDDYNIVAESVVSDTGTNTAYNVWGLDLSGSIQGAGGVGGLLAVVKETEVYTPAFDANGNVTEYLSADGILAAHYEYSPFGEIVVQSGDLADSFTHRFSTKPWCDITGLSEYLFRKYSPGMGRWISKDPIGEQAGILIVHFGFNNPLFCFDSFGLMPDYTPWIESNTFDGAITELKKNKERPHVATFELKDRKVKGYTSRSPGRTDCAICPDSPSTVYPCLAYGKWVDITRHAILRLPQWIHYAKPSVTDDQRRIWDAVMKEVQRHELKHLEIDDNHREMLNWEHSEIVYSCISYDDACRRAEQELAQVHDDRFGMIVNGRSEEQKGWDRQDTKRTWDNINAIISNNKK